VLSTLGELNRAFVNELPAEAVSFLLLFLQFVEVQSSDLNSEIGCA